MGKSNKSGKSQNVVRNWPPKCKTNNATAKLICFLLLSTSQQSENPADGKTFMVVLFYCLLIILSPVVAFFSFKLFLFDEYTTPVRSNIYSAVVAVVSLHIALGLYLYRASYDSGAAAKQQKED